MPLEIVITLAAILVSWFVFTGLVRVLKVAVGTAIKVAIILFLAQMFFGIGPETLWQHIIQLWQQLFSSFK